MSAKKNDFIILNFANDVGMCIPIQERVLNNATRLMKLAEIL